ncbi:MAG: BrnT family toxin [Microcystis aeruginosa]
MSFEAAQYVFADPLAVSRPDPYPEEERWQTIGLIGKLTVFVVHTWPESDSVTGEETGRIISAPRATAHERRAYEQGRF